MKNKGLLFLLILSIGIIFTYPAFPTSHALDSYCTICNGYSKTSLWFLQNGRVFSAIFYYFFELIKLPFNSLGFISVFLGDILLTVSILNLYKVLSKNINTTNKIYNLLLLLCVFLLYFNPLFTSILLLDEFFIMCLGILFLTLASIYLFGNNRFNYILSLIFTILGIMCYQGIASYMFVVLFIIIISSKKFRNNIRYIISKLLLSIINYGIAFLINFSIIKIVSVVLNDKMPKIGEFNIIDNLIKIFNKLLPDFYNLFGYVNIKYFYFLIIVLLVIVTIYIIKNNNKVNNIILLLLIVLSSILVPYIPNLFMSSSSNYIDARMVLTIGCLPSTIILYIMLLFYPNGKKIYLLSILGCLFALLTFYSIHQNMMIDLKRYKWDMKYIKEVNNMITYYENKNHIKIDKIYYALDTDVAYYYNFGNANGANIRLMAVPWSFECAFNAVNSNNYTLKKMKKKDYLKFFDGKNYDKLDDNEFVVVGNNLYVLIY